MCSRIFQLCLACFHPVRLSFKAVAIVGVNVKVQCTNDAQTADCSVLNATTEALPDATTIAETTTEQSQPGTTTTEEAVATVAAGTTVVRAAPTTNTQPGNITGKVYREVFIL